MNMSTWTTSFVFKAVLQYFLVLKKKNAIEMCVHKQGIALKALRHDLLSSENVASPLWREDMTWYGSHGFGVSQDVRSYYKYFVQVIQTAFSDRNIQLDVIVCEGKICGAHGYLIANFTHSFLGNCYADYVTKTGFLSI